MTKLTSVFAFAAAGTLAASLFVRPPVTPVTTAPTNAVTTGAAPIQTPTAIATMAPAPAIASPPPPGGRSFSVDVVAFAPWGSGPAEVGRIRPKEANPEAPMSLAVDASGAIHVLDQVNERIQIFDASGTFLRSVKIPSDTIQDLAIDSAGGYALLDRLVEASLIFIDGKGTVGKKVQLEGQSIPTTGLITALFAAPDGFWVEVEHKTLVRVALANGDPDPARLTLEGRRPRNPGPLLRAARDPSGFAIVSALASASSGGFLARVPFTTPVMALDALEGDAAGNVFVAAHLGREGAAPSFTIFDEKVTVVALGPSGVELGRFDLPPPEGPEEVFRSITIAPSGALFHLHVGSVGATIRRAR